MRDATRRTGVVMLAIAAALQGAAVRAEGEIASVYSKLDFDTGCVQLLSEESGGRFSCAGLGGYGVLFSEGDLRQSVFFGNVGEWYGKGAWESFSAFNRANDTIEWRLRDGVPYATILRWFIENANPETGAPDKRSEGQVLVISKVGQPGIGEACVVGYVDALATPDPNEVARRVADTLADSFTCRVDEPDYAGEPGPRAGYPSRYFGE